jgi:DNA-binding transcriptional MerR regulator
MARSHEPGCFIGDIAKRLKISQRTIRYYEERGLLNPTRTSGGFRVYAESEVERLETILLLKELGMSLDEIVSLIKQWHEGVPAEATPKMRALLLSRLHEFKDRIKKYERVIAQLEAVLKLLSICASCGKEVKESVCTSCLSKRVGDVPPLMKALL